ncbi:MAG: hypothetical protein ABFR89_02940 [Actinomycetota bacterium]
METLPGTLGAGDCEALGSGWLIQPVNAWSSLAYAVVGVFLLASLLSTRNRERTLTTVFGLLLVGTGIGSFLYHGPQSPIAHFAHDLSFLAALWFLALLNLTAASHLSRKALPAVFVAVIVVLGAALLLWPTSTNIHTGLSIVALGVSDILRRRAGGFAHAWHNAAAAAILASLLFNVLGRTGASTCDPDELFQFHGLWHTFSALALGAYFLAVLPSGSEDPS